MHTLYIYDHCPYCTKARMIFGLKGLPVEIKVLLNDDEATPTGLIGKKMVPILTKEDGSHMGESMDIVHYIDKEFGRPVLAGRAGNRTLNAWLEGISPILYPLVMPRWVKAPLDEFKTELARKYFIRKKELYIGPFADHIKNTDALVAQMNTHLMKLEELIESPEAVHTTLSDDDIHLFATLRSLSIVKGLTYPPKVEAYRQRMAEKSGVNMHDDIAL